MSEIKDDQSSSDAFAPEYDDDSAEDDEKHKSSPSKAKKGPGRPRKNPKKDPTPRSGIVSAPKTATNTMEFVYDNPTNIKKILTFFKGISAAQIQILFRPTEVIFYAQDHHKKSDVQIRIDTQKINHYYCQKVFDVGISCKELELVLNTVDKDCLSITLSSLAGQMQNVLLFSFDTEIEVAENYSIDLIGNFTRMTNEHEFNDAANYAINFVLPFKTFRKYINDAKSMSEEISFIQEDSKSLLQMGYMSKNRKIHCVKSVRNPAKIKFHSAVANDNSFRVDMQVNSLKPLCSSIFSEDITIYIDENKKFMTYGVIDNGTITIRTLTTIIDARQAV